MVHPHPLHHHLLIGLPGSGKTTLVKRWCAENPACCHVSTDRIRHILYPPRLTGSVDCGDDWDARSIAQRIAELTA